LATAVTSNDSSRSRSTTRLQLADSAKAPCTSTIAGFTGDMSVSSSVGGSGSPGREGPAQDVDGLLDRAGGGGGPAQAVEHHEVVERGVVAHARGPDAGFAEPTGEGLALVAQDVVLVDDEEGLGQSGELVQARPQR